MQVQNAPEQTLQAAFAARNEWHANRSSAIFPVRLRSGGDLLIAYLNYWAIKNRIDNVQRVLRLYTADGALAGRHSERVAGHGVAVSVAATFAINGHFDGMLEVEFIALDNLRFPFPAVQGFYSDGRGFSSVHSAGRSKNTDEAQPPPAPSPETNWICKFADGITPFFHVFCNGTPPGPLGIEVSVLAPDRSVLATRSLPDLLLRPFSSRLLAIDELFPELWQTPARPPEGSYCRVSVPQHGIFPRLVVGNLHRASDFLEVTHSFAEQRGGDFVVPPPGVELASFIPALKPAGLDLRLHSFPTNAPAVVEAGLRVQKAGAAALAGAGTAPAWRSGGDGAALMTYRLADDDRLISLDLRGGQVPSRLNVSYQFSVAGSASSYSTDVSTGAKSCVYPPKHSHWGSAVVGGGYRTVLMARNMSHRPGATQASRGTLKIWSGADDPEIRELAINAEAGAFWTLEGAGDTAGIVHWLANFDQPSIEMFWVSYADDGRICGDHAF